MSLTAEPSLQALIPNSDPSSSLSTSLIFCHTCTVLEFGIWRQGCSIRFKNQELARNHTNPSIKTGWEEKAFWVKHIYRSSKISEFARLEGGGQLILHKQG